MRLRNLYEVQIQPGERKGFSLRLKKLENLQLKVAEMQGTISTLKSTGVPDVLKNKMQELIDAANIEKEKLYSELSVVQKPVPGVEDIPGNVLKLFKGIDKNCSIIMNAYRNTGNFLFRGIKSSDEVLYGKPFDERRAKDSNKKLSDILNNALASQGFDARRDNTSFTSGDDSQAGNYGTVYIFIPRDGFTFHYSKKIRDLVLDPGKLNLLIDNELAKTLQQAIQADWEHVKQYFPHRYGGDKLFMDYEYERDLQGLQSAVQHGQLPQEFAKYKTLDDLISDEKVIQQFDYDQTDLEGAINSKHEVMVRGAYYALRRDEFESKFRKYLELTKTGPLDITPDNRKENQSLNDKVSAALGQQPEEFENGEFVKHKYEPIFGEVVNNFYTNDFLQVKNFNDELVLVKKSNVDKLDLDSIEKYEPGDKVKFETKGTAFSWLHGKRGTVVASKGIGVSVKQGYGDITEVPVFFVSRSEKYDTNYPEVGDTVLIKSGDFAGGYGKITYVSTYKDIDVDFGDGESEAISAGYYEVVDPKTVPADQQTNKFEVDSYVQVDNDGDKMSGLVGTIRKSGAINSTVRIFGNTGVHPSQKINNKRLKQISKEEFEKRQFNHGSEVIVVKGKHRGKVGKITYFYSNGSMEVTPIGKSNYFEVNGADIELSDKYTGKLDPAKAPAPKFKKGDVVTVTNGPLKDDVGTVDEMYMDGNFVGVYINGDYHKLAIEDVEVSKDAKPSNTTPSNDDQIIDFDFEPLEDPKPTKADTPKFKVYGKVNITDGDYKGQSGVIDFLYSDGAEAYVKVGDDYVDIPLTSLEPIPAKPVATPTATDKDFDIDALNFMVGDDANATNPKVVNKKWVVAEIHPDHVLLKNKTSDGLLKLTMDKFYKANPEFAPESTEFKIGDKVTVTTGPFKDFDGEITGDGNEPYELEVKINIFGKDNFVSVPKNYFKKAESKPDDDLIDLEALEVPSPGDKVVITKPAGIFTKYKGMKGEVVPSNYSNNDIDVKLENGNTIAIPEYYVEKEKFVKSSKDADSFNFPNPNSKDIIAKAKSAGKISYSEIDSLYNDQDVSSEQVEDLFNMFQEMGIDIVDGGANDSPNETTAEKKARILEPDNKEALKELFKDSEIKLILRKAVADKFVNQIDQLSLMLAADEQYTTLIVPYLELKGVELEKF